MHILRWRPSSLEPFQHQSPFPIMLCWAAPFGVSALRSLFQAYLSLFSTPRRILLNRMNAGFAHLTNPTLDWKVAFLGTKEALTPVFIGVENRLRIIGSSTHYASVSRRTLIHRNSSAILLGIVEDKSQVSEKALLVETTRTQHGKLLSETCQWLKCLGKLSSEAGIRVATRSAGL